MTDIRVGVQVLPQHASYRAIRDQVRRCEDLGADAVFVWDHFFPPLPGDPDPDGQHLECWSLLAALAQCTERVTIGSLVSCTAYRNPDLLADIARTVDHISGGRLMLGLGAGWFARDFDEYGYPYRDPRARAADFAAAVDRIAGRLRSLNPPPLGRVPILVGGNSIRSILPVAAAHAQVWHSFSDPAALARKLGVLQDLAVAAGRPGQVEAAVAVGRRHPRAEVAAGSPGQVGEAFVRAGASWLTVGIDTGPDGLDEVRGWLGWRDTRTP